MKRITAILLLLLLLFNLYGYQLVIDYMQHQHAEKLTVQLDMEAYADEDLISIKTALSLPYYYSSGAFERVDGSINIDGVEYNYVKRRIVADSLELLCLPNPVKQKLQTAKSDFFKISNDLQQPEGAKKAATVIKTVLPEYCNTFAVYTLPTFVVFKQKHRLSNTALLPVLFTPVQEHPPERMRTVS